MCVVASSRIWHVEANAGGLGLFQRGLVLDIGHAIFVEMLPCIMPAERRVRAGADEISHVDGGCCVAVSC